MRPGPSPRPTWLPAGTAVPRCRRSRCGRSGALPSGRCARSGRQSAAPGRARGPAGVPGRSACALRRSACPCRRTRPRSSLQASLPRAAPAGAQSRARAAPPGGSPPAWGPSAAGGSDRAAGPRARARPRGALHAPPLQSPEGSGDGPSLGAVPSQGHTRRSGRRAGGAGQPWRGPGLVLLACRHYRAGVLVIAARLAPRQNAASP